MQEKMHNRCSIFQLNLLINSRSLFFFLGISDFKEEERAPGASPMFLPGRWGIKQTPSYKNLLLKLVIRKVDPQKSSSSLHSTVSISLPVLNFTIPSETYSTSASITPKSHCWHPSSVIVDFHHLSTFYF